ncbi:MAG: hypothetical protein WBV39_06515 [Rudaea sp.]
MSLRIQSAHWFELLVPRSQLPQALDSLARAGQVELEARAESGWIPIDAESLRPLLAQAQTMRKRYANVWPAALIAPERGDRPAAEVRLRMAVEQLQNWKAAAEPSVAAMERDGAERNELARISDFLRLLGDGDGINFGRLAQPGGQMASALLVSDAALPRPPDFTAMLIKRVTSENHEYALVLGSRQAIAAAAGSVAGRQARLLHLPDWLDGEAPQALAQVRDRIGAIDADLETQRQAVDALSAAHRIADALGELDQLQWLTDHLAVLGASEHLVRVTGWTLASTPAMLLTPLHGAGIAAVAGFSPPPAGYRPPTRISNPRWARSFEFFLRLVGTPSGNEADPSVLVALIAPLMFGYMFGDMGQGVVLVAVGAATRRRWPAAVMLIPGGLLAIVFGWLFGSVFASTQIVAPAWTDPVQHPLPVLVVPLVLGGLLIVLGQLLNAASQLWAGRFGVWLEDEAGLLVAYTGAWALLLDARFGGMCVAAGLVWFVASPLRRGAWRQLPGRVGLALERGLQLAVNTLSFIRIGAFALAHAGLALAVCALAGTFTMRFAQLLVFVLGNALILALEGLVVGIQTTRLVLFEFFIRFVRGEGRPFRPLPPPVSSRGPS